MVSSVPGSANDPLQPTIIYYYHIEIKKKICYDIAILKTTQIAGFNSPINLWPTTFKIAVTKEV